jgi:hypothetical protein
MSTELAGLDNMEHGGPAYEWNGQGRRGPGPAARGHAGCGPVMAGSASGARQPAFRASGPPADALITLLVFLFRRRHERPQALGNDGHVTPPGRRRRHFHRHDASGRPREEPRPRREHPAYAPPGCQEWPPPAGPAAARAATRSGSPARPADAPKRMRNTGAAATLFGNETDTRATARRGAARRRLGARTPLAAAPAVPALSRRRRPRGRPAAPQNATYGGPRPRPSAAAAHRCAMNRRGAADTQGKNTPTPYLPL